jgi:hypothetical protein
MKVSKQKIHPSSRAAVKKAARQADRQRLERGENSEVIQRENSIFPPSYFEHHRILNFSSAIGK